MKRKKKTASLGANAAPMEDESWRARNDLDTLSRAQEVIGDGKRFSAAKREAARQQESLRRIARLEGKKL